MYDLGSLGRFCRERRTVRRLERKRGIEGEVRACSARVLVGGGRRLAAGFR